MVTSNMGTDELEKKRRQLGSFSLDGTKRFTHGDFKAESFLEWLEISESLDNPDLARSAIYFGFQPMLDALIAGGKGFDREKALSILDGIINIGTAFLSGYYSGKPDLDYFRESIKSLRPATEGAGEIKYTKKFRNVDQNQIYPKDIKTFIETFLDKCLDRSLAVPDYIVGCACGSSEIAMPLAGILGKELGFIRRSYRRGDDQPRIVKEHESAIRRSSSGKTVLCMEDYICTGLSLKRVMTRVRGYGAREVIGASVNNSREGSDVIEVVKQRKFHIYRLGD
ncbi:MAG TPA: phosphoribosyltransferase [archaeon]|nr:phosphoribosyltransferase [archaeon]